MKKLLNDLRRKIIPRQFIFDIADNTNIPFSSSDLEWIAENLEYLLQSKFDVTVENLEVKTIK